MKDWRKDMANLKIVTKEREVEYTFKDLELDLGATDSEIIRRAERAGLLAEYREREPVSGKCTLSARKCGCRISNYSFKDSLV